MTADETLAARLERLERDHRRLRTAVLIGGVVLVPVALGVVEDFRERRDVWNYGLETGFIEIHDRASRRVGMLGEHDDRPFLKFNDTAGHERMFLALEETGTALTLSDALGRPRVRLTVKEREGYIEVLDAAGKTVWSAP